MVLKAIGKYIDTLPINDLLSQEEVLADSVVFEVGRFYNGYDLAEFTFFMRGVTESRGETQTELTMEVQDEVLIKAIGFQKNAQGVWEMDLTGFFTKPCSCKGE